VAQYTRSEAKAGLVIVAALLLFGGILVFITDYRRILQPSRRVRVVFQDVQGLRVKDPVRYAGLTVGKVADIRIAPVAGLQPVGPDEPDTFRPPVENRRVALVTVSLPRDLSIRDDDVICVNRTLTGGLTVEIRPDGRGPEWQEDGPPIRGTEYPALTDYARRGSALLAAAEDAIRLFDQSITDIADGVGSVVGSVRRVLDEKQQEQLRAAIANLDQASADLAKSARRVTALLEDDGEAARTVEEARRAAAELQKLIAESRDDAAAAVKNLRRTSERLEGLTGDAALAVGKLNTVLDRTREPVGDAARDLRTMARNLETWSEDVRRKPWLLLRKPDEEETARRDLAFAARQLRESLAEADRTVGRLLDAARDEKLPDPDARKLATELKKTMDEVRALHGRLERRLR
jgi:phospholipid/cholesterol/gamma-HCH transport system substrate-binding protein